MMQKQLYELVKWISHLNLYRQQYKQNTMLQLQQQEKQEKSERQSVMLSNTCSEIKKVLYWNQQRKYSAQGDHLSGKPGNVREFDSCLGIW